MAVRELAAGVVAWHRFESLGDASEALAEAVAIRLATVIAERGAALIAVPGGTTPARFLAALGEHDLAWEKVTLLPTDERFVSPDDPASNERMIRASFSPLAQGRARFLSFHGGHDDLESAAAAVSATLAALPPIDLLVSGMGADGHIASLFPGDGAALGAAATQHAVAARPSGLPERISLSPARLSTAGWAALLVAGPEKQQMLAGAQALPAAFPVGLLLARPQGLDVYWARL
jgi:6-phosphogluconolactonase